MKKLPRTLQLPDDLFAGADDPEPELTTQREGPSQAMLNLVREQREKAERKKARPKTIAAAVFTRALAEVDEMLRTGDWQGAGARHLVALYDRLHQRCYGIEPLELGPSERFVAVTLAAAMLKKHFDGDVVEMVEFMLWTWDRELDNEKWRRENGREGRRIGVRLMFHGSLLTDYLRLARRRKAT